MNTFNTSQSIGDIVTMMPKASEVFKRYRIDFCCGGKRPLSEAIAEQKLDEQEVLTELQRTYEEAQELASQANFGMMSLSDLADYIVNTHHVFDKRILSELGNLVATILRVHGPNHKELFKVHKLFSSLKTDLDQHFIKEEEILFPMIREYDRNPSKELIAKIKADIEETEDEHEAAGAILKELRQVTDDYRLPEDACGTYRVTYEKFRELEADIFQHIHLENNILFKQIERESN